MNHLLNDYAPISLEEMSGIRLMNRTDTKFVTSRPLLERLLQMAAGDYRVQEIDGQRIASYYTLYFDTSECDMFRAHHCGKLNRQKLRIRSYVDSHLDFLEVKTKDNHGRTRKKRVKMSGFDPLCPPRDLVFQAQDDTFRGYDVFLREHLRYEPASLTEQLENRFDRITLVNKQKTERLTIDMNLRFHNVVTGRDQDMGQLVIVELKRDGLLPSPVTGLLRQLRIHPHGFSKYCIGTALTNDRLSANRFKPKVTDIRKIAGLPSEFQLPNH